MNHSSLLHHQHLAWRTGFGPHWQELNSTKSESLKKVWNKIRDKSEGIPAYIDVMDEDFKSLVTGREYTKLSEGDKKKLREQNRANIKQLNLMWLQQMVESPRQLNEKMAFFWHSHFACRSLNSLHQQQLLDIIRSNALGNFGSLLKAVSKSAAMLNFLNNNQNKKGSPNENFAREVMELFTLGRGYYSETDIKEAARAFTGWGNNPAGEFIFRKPAHDSGIKTVLGKTGNLEGDHVLDLLLSKKQTAVFITRKIYRFLVNEKIDEQIIQELAAEFFENNYEIMPLLDKIFSSKWFFEDKNIGCKIKSPIELLAGMQRSIPLELKNPESQFLVQRILGQVLFYPPNVAGWPGGQNWIDSSTLLFRMKLPQIISQSEEQVVQPKTDDDQMMGMSVPPKKNNNYVAQINWNALFNQLQLSNKNDLVKSMREHLLLQSPSFSEEWARIQVQGNNPEEWIRFSSILFMSTPEYQLC